jgi:hypothetical protein
MHLRLAHLTSLWYRHAEASHFWLNEGWTTYIERLLQQFLHSPAERGFQYVIGSTALSEALGNYVDRPKYQRLVIDFEPGEDPDDSYSSIPYEKGSNFLLYLGVFSFSLMHCLHFTGLQNRHSAVWTSSYPISEITLRRFKGKVSRHGIGKHTYTRTLRGTEVERSWMH